MAARPVQVSIDTDLLKRIDRDQEAQKNGRSAFIRSAVVAYLQAKERRRIDDEIRSGYGPHAADLAKEIDELAGSQAWPDE